MKTTLFLAAKADAATITYFKQSVLLKVHFESSTEDALI